MRQGRVGVGLIGCGRIGAVHAANVAAHPRAELVAVQDASSEVAAATATAHGAQAVPDVEALLSLGSVDAVVIASPTPTHIEFLEASVQSGKATFCEKPIDLDIERVDACRATLSGLTSKVMLGFHRRFDPSIRTIHDAALAGEIGNLETIRILARDPGLPPFAYIAVSGGQARDMAIHDLDLVRWLMPDEPTTIAAMGSVLIDPAFAEHEDTDTLEVLVRTVGGRLAHVENSRRATYGYDQRLELFGSRGALKMTNQHPTSVERWSAAGTQHRDPVVGGFTERYAQAYRNEMDHFITATADGGPYAVGFEDGRRALMMADAVAVSLQETRFVELDFGD